MLLLTAWDLGEDHTTLLIRFLVLDPESPGAGVNAPSSVFISVLSSPPALSGIG